VLIHDAFSMTETSPVFMWSNTQTFTGRNIQEINVIPARALSKFINTESPISQYLTTKGETPEVIVVFVEPFLASEQIPILAHAYDAQPNGGVFSHIKTLVESARSSLVIPYTSSPSVGTEFIRSLTASLNGGSVYTVEDSNINVDSPNHMTASELVKKLGSSSWSPLSNGITDLIVVHFSASVSSNYDDAAIQKQYESDDQTVADIVSALGDVKYLAIFTSESGSSRLGTQSSRRSEPNGAHMKAFNQRFGQSYDTLYTTNWPDGAIEALIVMIPFIVILFIGICCTFCVQSDLKYDAEKTFMRKHK